ncbi:hypothetical protein ERO13_A10G077750v2 [Gossypium hirsutum]|nr:hypothetical protein ERO13_A10G077750v2 [Gossypium hirsutum]
MPWSILLQSLTNVFWNPSHQPYLSLCHERSSYIRMSDHFRC